MWRQNPRSEPEAGAATAAMAATAAATAVHGADGEQDDNRADDGGHPGAEVEEGVEGADVEHGLGDPAAKQRADDPGDGGDDEAGALAGELLRDDAGTAPSTIQARMPMTTH